MTAFQFLFLGLAALPLAAGGYALFSAVQPFLRVPAEPLAERRWLPPPASGAGPGGGRAKLPAAARLLILPVLIPVATVAYDLASTHAGLPRTISGGSATIRLSPPPPAVKLAIVRAVGSSGSGPGQLHDPRDLALDRAGNVYVADTGNHRVARFGPDGRFVSAWSDSASGPLVKPVAVAAVRDGIVVADNQTGLLHKYTFAGRPVAGFEHNLGLYRPRGLTAAPGGVVYVADTGGNRLVKVGPSGASEGDIRGQGTQLDQPISVAVDPRGNLYVAEPDAKRIEKITPAGKLLAQWFLTPATTVTGPRLLWLPGQGLLASQPNQNTLALYSTAGAITRQWSVGGAPIRPLSIALSARAHHLWVLGNATAQALEVAVPGR
ncbi:MAG: NHL repeat-containing protein [Chloroflexota bacterium]